MAAPGDCALRARESGVDVEVRKSVSGGGGYEPFQKREEEIDLLQLALA
jgi:hypothetical protein